MANVLQEKNLFLVYSENFFFLTWKFDESDIKPKNCIQSSEFQLVEGETSFLDMKVTENGLSLYIYLWNPSENVKKNHFTALITDEDDSVIHKKVVSENWFSSAADKVDLMKSLPSLGLPKSTKYPIIITCISISWTNTTEESNVNTRYSVLSHNLQQLSADFKKILDLTSYSDIVLNVDGDKIKAHKMILQARSPVFYKMFTHDIANTPIEISDMGLETMKKLLHFIYTGTMEKCSFDETLELYYAADKYEVISLRDCCRTELMNLLNVSNACILFALANRHSDEAFKRDVVTFVSANFNSVVKTESFNEMGGNDAKLLTRLCVLVMTK